MGAATNGAVLVGEAPNASIPADDRGLAYGDGLFETIAVVAGRPRLLAYHLERLACGASRLSIALDLGAVETTICARAGQLGDGVLKYVLTRGSGPRGYQVPPVQRARHVTYAVARPSGFADAWWHHEAPIKVVLCRTPLGAQPALAGIKHLNRLEQVLARNEWHDDTAHEGLMRVVDGGYVCATAANVFALVGDRLVTSDLTRAGVAGVMRRALLTVAPQAGLAITYADLTDEMVRGAADALLLTSSLTGLRRVGEVIGVGGVSDPSGVAADALEALRAALARHVGVRAS